MDSKFKKDFLKGSAAATIGTVSAMAFHFISLMFLTRNLNQNDFGIYVIILVIVNLFVVLSGLGLNITLVKFITGTDETKNFSSFRSILILRTAYLIFVSIIFYALAGLILPLFNLNDTRFILFIPLLFAAMNYRELFFNLLQGLRLYKKFAVVQTVSAVMRVVFIFLLIKMELLNITNLVYIELATAAVTAIILLFTVPFKNMMSFSPEKGMYRRLLKFSFPVYLNNLLTFSYDRVSIFIIGALLNPVSVALFDVASKIPEALQRMSFSFTIVFFPNQSKLFGEGNVKGAAALMNKSLHFFSVVIMSGVLISFLFGEEIIRLLFTEAYIESSLAFSLLMLNLYFRILSNIMGYSLIASGNSSAPVKVNSVTAIVNLIFSIIFIPEFGFIGAVYALLIMNTLSQMIYHWYVVRSKIFDEGINYLRPLFIIIVLLVPYYLLPYSLLINAAIIAAYFIICWFYVWEFRNFVSGFAGYIIKKRKLRTT